MFANGWGIYTLQCLFCYLEHILRKAFFSVILFLFATFYFKLEPNHFMNMKLAEVENNWAQKDVSILGLSFVFLVTRKGETTNECTHKINTAASSHKETEKTVNQSFFFSQRDRENCKPEFLLLTKRDRENCKPEFSLIKTNSYILEC